MTKQYLILSLISYSNVSALNGAFLKVSGRQYIQPAFIINLSLKITQCKYKQKILTATSCVGLALSKITTQFKFFEKTLKKMCKTKNHTAAFLKLTFNRSLISGLNSLHIVSKS